MKRIRLLTIWLVAILVVLELALQIVAIVVAVRQPSAVTISQDGKRRVLCVGDSWTQGVGASSAETAYPKVLERLLRQRDPSGEWRVSNAGRSGRNSREVLELLPGQLKAVSPTDVVVLVGLNDVWSLPGELVLDDDSDHATGGFRLEFRLLRCWKLAHNALTATHPTTMESWPTWAAPRTTPRYPWPSVPWVTDGENQELRRRAERLVKLGDSREALRLFEQGLAKFSDDVIARCGAAVCAGILGEITKANDHLRVALDQYRSAPIWIAAERIARALRELRRPDQLLEFLVSATKRFPDSGRLWNQMAWSRWERAEHVLACAAGARAVDAGPTSNHYFDLARFQAKNGQRELSLRTLFTGYLLFGYGPGAVACFNTLRIKGGRGAFDKLAAESTMTDVQRRGVERLRREMFERSPGESGRVYAAHLRQIISLAQQSGARVLVTCYPLRFNEFDPQRRVVCEELNADYLDMTVPFLDVFETRTWNDLRSPDDHFADEGYEFIARFIADRIMSWGR